jgi:hypothetical protein
MSLYETPHCARILLAGSYGSCQLDCKTPSQRPHWQLSYDHSDDHSAASHIWAAAGHTQPEAEADSHRHGDSESSRNSEFVTDRVQVQVQVLLHIVTASIVIQESEST